MIFLEFLFSDVTSTFYSTAAKKIVALESEIDETHRASGSEFKSSKFPQLNPLKRSESETTMRILMTQHR